MARNYGHPYLHFILCLLAILVICQPASAAGRMCKGTKEEDPGCWELSTILASVFGGIFGSMVVGFLVRLIYVLCHPINPH
ncbi:Protein of unknown function [Pyronema omphalodes CBS 100304]|uniref:Uncharacterized protein n=1 Tax=Pyronema omphalodes (strain CBS 100304) TaxID=1076935 RepID=U4LNG6_PYROM|nr:Protein of unknown function [Pyronema omphalodes CBS 100304]